MVKLYKQYRVCKGCNQKFIVQHKLRLYCDNCRQRMSKKTAEPKKATKSKAASKPKKKAPKKK